MPRRPASLKADTGPLAEFASALRTLRDQAGANSPTIEAISKQTGVPRSTLYAALQGKRLPSRDAVVALAQAWGGQDSEWLARRSEAEAAAHTGKEDGAPGGRSRPRPRQIGVIPPLAASFQPRRLLHNLSQILEGRETSSLVPVLTGLSGVGKTQLAAAYAHNMRFENDVDLVIWVNASLRNGIINSYAQAASDILKVDTSDPELASAKFLAWLATTDQRWLIVLDDLASLADIRSLWPPKSPHGRTIVTTRRRDAVLSSGERKLLDVTTFTPAEASNFLRTRLEDDDVLLEHEALAADLGYLPLALAQAAAFIADYGLTCAEYRTRFADRKRTLTDLLPDASFLPDDHVQTVSAAFSLSIQRADQLRPAGVAHPLLELISLFDANGIPTQVLTGTPALTYISRRRMQKYEVSQTTSDDIHDALRCLHRLNLITFRSDGDSVVQVHALVQRFAREQIPADDLAIAVQLAADALTNAWDSLERDPHQGHTLRVNALSLADSGADLLWSPAAHPVLFRVGASIGESGLVHAAINYWANLHASAAQILGPEHPDALVSRHHSAYWRGVAGDPAGAAAATEALLADMIRVLGPDHPDTLATRANLARWRGEAGDTAGAAAATEALLGDMVRVLGPDHPDTLATRANVAGWRGEAGDTAGAAAIFEDLLADRLRVLGPDHPDTLTTRHNLAYWRGAAGDPTGAAAALEDLLADRLRVLGPDHPDTLATRANVARWRGEGGDTAGAAHATEALLVDMTRVLGPDHPHTLATRANVARWRGEAGDAAGAAAALEQLLADRRRVLGADHPDTLAVDEWLARWRREMDGLPAQEASVRRRE